MLFRLTASAIATHCGDVEMINKPNRGEFETHKDYLGESETEIYIEVGGCAGCAAAVRGRRCAGPAVGGAALSTRVAT